MSLEKQRELWAEYHAVCLASKKTDRYDRVEPLAWRRLQQELRKLKSVTRAA